MKKLRIITMLFVISLFSMQAYSQVIGWGGQLGYAKPQGDAFTDAAGNPLSSFGISYEADILFCPDFMDNKLGLGITYYGSALFGKTSQTATGIGMYGLSLYGIKGQYRLRHPDSKVSPFVSLGLGVTQFESPEITYGTSTVVPGVSSYSFGMRPEIGLDLGSVVFSVAYLVPMKYDIDSPAGSFKGSAGTLTFSIGYRNYLSF